MKLNLHSLSVALLIPIAVFARNADDLKADLESLLPAGKTSARCAWIKGGPFTEFALETGNTAVFVVNSEDGAIHQLYPENGTGPYCNVNISADGSRVFFLDRNAGTTCAINWDGSNFEEIDLGGDFYEYWYDAGNQTDWAIVNTGGMSRVKIDAPHTSVQIADFDVGGDGCGLSDDGTLFYGYNYNHDPAAFGTIDVSTLTWDLGPHGGCQGTMSGGSAPKYHHNPSGHTQLCIHDAVNQDQFAVYQSTETVMAELETKNLTSDCESFASNEGARFAQHPDFISFYLSNSKANPILMRIPDMEFVYIEDNLSCGWCGDMDAVFLPLGSQTAIAQPSTTAARIYSSPNSHEIYSLDGRRMAAAQHRATSARTANARGIVIQRTMQKADLRILSY